MDALELGQKIGELTEAVNGLRHDIKEVNANLDRRIDARIDKYLVKAGILVVGSSGAVGLLSSFLFKLLH